MKNLPGIAICVKTHNSSELSSGPTWGPKKMFKCSISPEFSASLNGDEKELEKVATRLFLDAFKRALTQWKEKQVEAA